MRIIGLTGGIGCGKSTVSDYLREKGCAVVDADRIAREIVQPGSPVLLKLAEAFGEEILSADGTLDRKKLGGIVFADPEKKELLDGLTHGAIRAEIERQIHVFSGETLVLDVPLLFEAGLSRLATEVWVVDAAEEVRMKRLKERDGMDGEEIKKRIASQLSSEEKRKRADFVLENSGTVEELRRRVDELIGV